jgi:hypothetical protein
MTSSDDLYERLAAMHDTHEKTDARATTVLGSFQVADYEHWRAGYERAVAADPEILSHRIWRGQDDPTFVVIAEFFDSRSYAEMAWNNEATREAMARDGIDMTSLRFDFLDEVGGHGDGPPGATTALVHHRVADYDAWRRVFDEVVAGPLYEVVRSHGVWRGQDDPNLVVVGETYDSRAGAEAAFSDPAGLEAMAHAGVDTSSMQIHYLDEVASGSH